MTPMRLGIALFGCAVVMMTGCKPISIVCGDGFCEGTETCGSCVADCSRFCAPACGNGRCESGETTVSCPGDCPAAAVCGNGTCQAGESCMNCTSDCGACTGGCGDGICQGSDTCSNCPRDCGACGFANPYERCAYDSDCSVSRDSCISVNHAGVTAAFCGVTNCSTDLDCDNDMFGSPGLCVSFDAGADFNCFHRCRTSADCMSGYSCSPTDGSASTLVCLPGSTASVPPYRICGSSADCAGGLICETFSVSGAAPAHLCSLTGCATDNDCPFDMRGGRGACLNFGAGMTACWERCTVRGNCANTTQFDCTTSVGGFTAPVPVCVPR